MTKAEMDKIRVEYGDDVLLWLFNMRRFPAKRIDPECPPEYPIPKNPTNPCPQKSKINKMKKELFNQLLASETTEELVDLLPYDIKRDHLLTADKISSVFRSESKLSITLDDKTILTWGCEQDSGVAEYVWTNTITEENIGFHKRPAIVPKNPKSIFEESTVFRSGEFENTYFVPQSWAQLTLNLEQLQNLFYIKGS